MQIMQLDSKQLHAAIIMGCQYVVNQQGILNQINVFPVADGDTGSNMASTASAILNFSAWMPTIEETLTSIADASLRGARGNSGIIFSEFFNGLAKLAMPKDYLTIHDFSRLVNEAATGVRQAITTPVDGTILTVMEAWANLANQYAMHTDCFNQFMAKILPQLKQVVENTANTLAVLQTAKVVDSGALGFYFFTQGFTHSLSQSNQEDEQFILSTSNADVEHSMEKVDTYPKHRYCTEAILKSDSLNKAQIIKILEQHGDSALITGNERLSRFHVHTNNPSEIFPKLFQHGTIQYPKVDDMLRQFEVNHQRKYNIALVTDSGADLPQSLLDQHQIHQIPLNIHFDEHHLLDRYCFDTNLFYNYLAELADYPKTSSPSPTLIEEKLKFLATHYEHVLVLSISTAMSSTYNAFTKAAEKYPNIKVIDTRTTTGAQGLLLDYASELIAAGKPIDVIIQSIEKAIAHTDFFVHVEQFDSLIRSGRISKFAGQIAQFARVKPIISADAEGKGFVCAKSFSANNSLIKLINLVEKKLQQTNMKLMKYCIVHADAQEKAKDFAQLTTEVFKMPPAYIESASLAIGLHAGKGCVGLVTRIGDEEIEEIV